MRPGMEPISRSEKGLEMAELKLSVDLWMDLLHEDSKILLSLRSPAEDSGNIW
jgi:hypothetical protein